MQDARKPSWRTCSSKNCSAHLGRNLLLKQKVVLLVTKCFQGWFRADCLNSRFSMCRGVRTAPWKCTKNMRCSEVFAFWHHKKEWVGTERMGFKNRCLKGIGSAGTTFMCARGIISPRLRDVKRKESEANRDTFLQTEKDHAFLRFCLWVIFFFFRAV